MNDTEDYFTRFNEEVNLDDIKFVVEYCEYDHFDIDDRRFLVLDFGEYVYDFFITQKNEKYINDIVSKISEKKGEKIKLVDKT